MKMEMAVQSQMNGVIRATHVAVGDKVDPEDLLVEIEEQQWLNIMYFFIVTYVP